MGEMRFEPTTKKQLWVFYETWMEHIGQEPQVQCKYDEHENVNDKVKWVEIIFKPTTFI